MYYLILCIAILIAIWLVTRKGVSTETYANQVIHAQAGSVAGPITTVKNYPRTGMVSLYGMGDTGVLEPNFDPSLMDLPMNAALL